MRKFIPRIFNLISFCLAMLFFFPWLKISRLFNLFYTKTGWGAFRAIQSFFSTYTSYRIALIPAILVTLSALFFIIGRIDRAKSANKKTSKPISNMTYGPLYYLIIAGCTAGLLNHVYSIFNNASGTFQIVATDYFGLARFVQSISVVARAHADKWGVLYYSLILVLAFIEVLLVRNVGKRKFFGNMLAWLCFAFLALFATKGIWSTYSGNLGLHNLYYSLFASGSSLNPVESELSSHQEFLVFIAFAIFFVVEYIAIGIGACHKTNRKMKQEKEELLAGDEAQEEAAEETQEPVVETQAQVVEEPKKETSTKIENKTINLILKFPDNNYTASAQPVHNDNTPVALNIEKHNLNEVFSNDFGFSDVVMVKSGDVTAYYRDGNKFLTLSNANKTIVFIAEVDQAIKLMTQYPGISKETIESHKMWFRIDDASLIAKDAVIGIVIGAYKQAK